MPEPEQSSTCVPAIASLEGDGAARRFRAQNYEVLVSGGARPLIFILIPPLPYDHDAVRGSIGIADHGDPVIIVANMRLRLEKCSFAGKVLLYSGRPMILVEVGPSFLRETQIVGYVS